MSFFESSKRKQNENIISNQLKKSNSNYWRYFHNLSNKTIDHEKVIKHITIFTFIITCIYDDYFNTYG